MKKIVLSSLVALGSFIALIGSAHSKDVVEDKFRIALGGYSLTRFDSALSLTEPNLGVGVSINPVDTFGLDTEQSVARLDGHYRFNNKHALTYSWYRLTSNGNKTIQEQIDWVDDNGNEITIPVGARVDTVFELDVYKVGYLWSFYHSDKVRLAAGGGLHITGIKLGLEAETVLTQNLNASDVSVTVPLPVLSFAMQYNVTKKFHWWLKSEIFAISFEDWEGTYTDSTLGLEYRVWKHIGLGAGLASNAISISEKTDKFKFSYDNRISGLMFFMAGYF